MSMMKRFIEDVCFSYEAGVSIEEICSHWPGVTASDVEQILDEWYEYLTSEEEPA